MWQYSIVPPRPPSRTGAGHDSIRVFISVWGEVSCQPTCQNCMCFLLTWKVDSRIPTEPRRFWALPEWPCPTGWGGAALHSLIVLSGGAEEAAAGVPVRCCCARSPQRQKPQYRVDIRHNQLGVVARCCSPKVPLKVIYQLSVRLFVAHT
jgi:hypothetical protein